MKRQIKFVVIGKKWFDKANGNTYHSVRCVRCSDAAVVVAPFQYGYGSQYEQTALETMFDAGWFKHYRQKSKPREGYKFTKASLFRLEQENNYPILSIVSYGLKQECVDNGRL